MKNHPRKTADKRLFLASWLRSPFAVGAVAPSSPALGKLMAAQIDLSAPGVIVELGGGTGAVTKALLATGLSPKNLIIVERDEGFARLLAGKFPEVRVLRGDASRLDRLLRHEGITEVSRIVSSLPLLSMPRQTRLTIMVRAFAILAANGVFVQFTYGLKSPLPEQALHKSGIVARSVGRVWRNMPPATVWRFEKKTFKNGHKRTEP